MHLPTFRFLLAAATLAAAPAHAAIYTVGSGAGCTHATIQAAIDASAAAGSNQADQIRLSGGPYTGQRLTMNVDAAHGAIALVGGYATCASSAPTAGARTVIGGTINGLGQPALRVTDTADVSLRNLEIRDADGGGGLVIETGVGTATSRATLVDTLVTNNRNTAGGGLVVANYNPGTQPDRLQVELQGATAIAFNVGNVRGGGISCVNASLAILDTSNVHDNSAGANGFAGSLDGGGIHAEDCRLDISSTGAPGNGALYRNTAALAGRGGGLYLTGTRGEADFHPVAAGTAVLVSTNRALDGGGIAVAGGASVRMYGGSVLLDNLADRSGGAVWLAPGGAAGLDTRFLMQSAIDDAPEGTVACANPAYCAMATGNSAEDPSGNSVPGAVVGIASGSAGTAHAMFRGVRIVQNDGYSLTTQEPSNSRVTLDGSLVVENSIRGGFGAFAVASADGAFVLSASTVAANVFEVAGSTVFGTPTTCDVANDDIGVHLRRSVIWQPGHSLLFTLFEPPQATCFTHLIANDFGWLGPAADRVVADPAFENVAGGDYRPSSASPALDFAPANAGDGHLGDGPRVIDLPAITNLFGAQDLGAFERTYSPTVTASVAGTGGTVSPASQSVPFGQSAQLGVFAFGGWHAVLPFGGDCPAGTLDGTTYTTGPITASCAVVASFIHDTSIALASTDDSSVYGQSLTFTATLAAASPTGSVTFRDGATVLGTVPLSGTGANFTTSALGVGTHSITAQYAGDAQNTPATSPVLAQSVGRAATVLTVIAPPSIHYGESANVVAVIAPQFSGAGTPPAGTVTVTAGAGSGSCTFTLPVANCLLTPLGAVGPLTVSATYSGDANYTGSVGTQMLEVVPQFVGGSISGLTTEGLELRLLVDGDPVGTTNTAAGATTFQFVQAVPVGASYQVLVTTHPPGLFCTVSGGSGTMPASDVASVALACSAAPHAILALAVDDGLDYARYGQTLTYTVTLGNTGTAAASNVAIAATAGPALDAGALAWTCSAAAGAACGASGIGGLADNAQIPVGGHVTYTVVVPVRATTNEPRARLEVWAGVEQQASDSDTLVLLRDGFDGD